MCKLKCCWPYTVHPRQHPPFAIPRKANQSYAVSRIAALLFKPGLEGRIVRFSRLESLLKSGSHQRWHFLEAAAGRGMMGFFSDPAASQPTADSSGLEGCRRETHSNGTWKFRVIEGLLSAVTVCVIEFTHGIISETWVSGRWGNRCFKKKKFAVMANLKNKFF